MAETALTLETFEEEVLKSDKPVLVDFWANWCGPCKMQGPVLAQFAEEHPEYKVCKVDVDAEEALSARYKVVSIPFLAVFNGGEMVNSEVGFHDIKALERMMEKN